MPAVGELVRQMTGKEPYRGLIPEGIVTGAVLQAAILRGELKEMLLLDVNPMSLGIEIESGTYVKLIERNTTIPTKRSEIFTTSNDDQSSISVHVVEGEHVVASYNSTLAVIELAGIAAAPRGIPQIEIIFEIDANGVLSVSAKNLGTGNSQSVTINRDMVAAARSHLPVPTGTLPTLSSSGTTSRDSSTDIPQQPRRQDDGPPYGEPKSSAERRSRFRRR